MADVGGCDEHGDSEGTHPQPPRQGPEYQNTTGR